MSSIQIDQSLARALTYNSLLYARRTAEIVRRFPDDPTAVQLYETVRAETLAGLEAVGLSVPHDLPTTEQIRAEVNR